MVFPVVFVSSSGIGELQELCLIILRRKRKSAAAILLAAAAPGSGLVSIDDDGMELCRVAAPSKCLA